MFKPAAWVIAGAAVLATSGVAHAQQAQTTISEADAARGAVPWYQRFTTSNGVTESITGERENDRILPPAWTLNQRWGVTLDVREAEPIERPDHQRGDQTSVGAYYQFTPNLRLGGEVSLETQDRANPITPADEEPRAGVRVESAFRF